MPATLYNPSSLTSDPVMFRRAVQEEFRQIGELVNGWGRQGVYSPVWSASGAQPTLGNGTLIGRYALVSGMVFLALRLGVGSTTGLGTGDWRFSTPFPVGQPDIGTWQGSALASKSGGQHNVGVCHFNSNGNPNLLNAYFHGTTSALAGGVPFAWANGDQLVLNCTYPVA